MVPHCEKCVRIIDVAAGEKPYTVIQCLVGRAAGGDKQFTDIELLRKSYDWSKGDVILLVKKVEFFFGDFQKYFQVDRIGMTFKTNLTNFDNFDKFD